MQNKANQTGQNASNNGGETTRKDLPEEICSIWLELKDIFQTFEDLDSVKDKQAEIKAIRQLLDEEDSDEEAPC